MGITSGYVVLAAFIGIITITFGAYIGGWYCHAGYLDRRISELLKLWNSEPRPQITVIPDEVDPD